jgi:hypothetical protein
MSYPDREADTFDDELAKCSVLYTENLVAEREALIAENAALAAELAACKTLKPISHDDWYALHNKCDALNVQLTEAMRLLAKEGIHMDDHGCWCN